MAKVISTSRDAALYEEDFPLWAERQAELLRGRRFDALDLENLIEEVEDLSRRQRDEVERFTLTILEHLLKLAYSPASRPRRGWLVTVDKQRPQLSRKLTTTLRNHLNGVLPTLYSDLRRPMARMLTSDRAPPDALPRTCPYTLDQILDPDWYPDNVHGRDEATP